MTEHMWWETLHAEGGRLLDRTRRKEDLNAMPGKHL
jgi:hypothetical protein